MDEIMKQENRIMGDYSIAKSYKGILRIAHILDLVLNEEDRYFNPTYYGIPNTLMNISGGAYESNEMGYATPIDGMNGNISRYTSTNSKINDDTLRIQRVPMTDSMGNYLNWNIGVEGVTIGSDENIDSNHIDIEQFYQNDYIRKTGVGNYVIWLKKYFPVLEGGHIVVGLQNKEFQTNKKRINKKACLTIQNHTNLGKLIVENDYDKSFPVVYTCTNDDETISKNFINYDKNDSVKHRTIYTDNKENAEEYDVFMYRQDDYDCHNYEDYKVEGIHVEDVLQRGNEEVLKEFDNNGVPITKLIDANVGIVNLKEYVNDVIQKYMLSTLVEVPTGAIINQFCSLEKWYAYPDDGYNDDLNESSYAGHRPALMTKRDVGLITSHVDDDESEFRLPANNVFVQSTIMGACRKINKLLNTNSSVEVNTENENTEDSKDLEVAVDGFYQEIIPLYKRDYVLCDGSIYTIFPFPKNFSTNKYPNRRDSLERFLDLFFAIGYQYTKSPSYINKEFIYTWDSEKSAYKISQYNLKADLGLILSSLVPIKQANILKYNKPEGLPLFNEERRRAYVEDVHTLFVEDFLTILAFENLYEKLGKGNNTPLSWNYEDICNWLKSIEIPEKYRINTFIGDTNESVKEYVNKSVVEIDKNFVMELPYYNFNNDGNLIQDEDTPLPLIYLGREVKTFGDPIKFLDTSECHIYNLLSKRWEYDDTKAKWTIIEAYKIPQIQYIIDMMLNRPNDGTLAPILDTYFRYDFQVPHLTDDLPTFIGSSGILWCDINYRKIRQPESWASTYSQKNYMHRHLLFVEPRQADPNDAHLFLNQGYVMGDDGNREHKHGQGSRYSAESYSLNNNASTSSFVASAAWRGGEVFCGNSPRSSSFKFNSGDNPNYIWNELGAGDSKISNMTISNEDVLMNGMRYPIYQASSNSEYHSWDTGNYRITDEVSKNDFNQCAFVETTDESVKVTDEVWNIERTLNDSEVRAILDYDRNHWYGWEHHEDPRFASAEPNRGRTSNAVNFQFIKSVSRNRYKLNEQNFPENLNPAEWYSPENIKMLPLIKL